MFHSSISSPFVNDDSSVVSFFDAGGVGVGSEYHPPPSLPSSYFLHRSNSSHSLQPSGFSDNGEFHSLLSEPVRRVFSAEDLQCTTGSVTSGDTYLPDATGRIGRYSAEERRERIERYRSKRNQRNFHKKITYACRKTLADSRPRVRGRFARNGETEHEAEPQESGFDSWSSYGLEIDMESVGAGGAGVDCWRKMQVALETTDEEEGGYEEDLWASLDNVFAMNFSSGLS